MGERALRAAGEGSRDPPQGLAWLDGESKTRFGKVFADATPEQQTALVDDIVKTGTDAHKKGFDFFKLFRDRVAGGYYFDARGLEGDRLRRQRADGGIPGPPPEVLKHLGLA